LANRAAHLFASAARHPGKPAIVFEGAAISFGALAERVRNAAASLAAQGIGKGTRAGLMMPACPDFIVVQQALFALGAVVSPLNSQYRTGEVAHALASCDLEFLVLAPEFAGRVPPGFGGAILRESADLPAPGPFRLADVAPADVVMLLLTSATTGKSKGVMLTAANLAANYDRSPAWLGITGDDIILCALPLYNTFGLNQCINAMALTGASLVLLPRFDPAACIAAVRQHHCTYLPAVPTMLQRLVDHPGLAPGDLAALRRIMTGGAPVPAALLARVLEAAGEQTQVLTGYGLTEASALVTLARVELGADGELLHGRTIGTVLEGIELAVRGEDGRDLPPGETGEFVIRGPNVMAGYYNAPAANAEVFAGDWLRSGDLGYLDADGFGFIVDRKKDVIIRGGQNIYPADIEEVLYQFPGVAEVAVVGLADEHFGEIPIAYIASAQSVKLSAETLLDHCKTHLARYKQPTEIRFLAELPKGPTGKILRRALRDAITESQTHA
jgi:long-chain acyl-CoA synthetase